MLQKIGDKFKGRVGTAILTAMGFIFALWGAYGVVNISFSTPDYGLKVNGETISNETVDRIWQQRQAQYVQALGGAALSDFQRKVMQDQLVQDYVRDTLVRQRAQSAGYRATNEQVGVALHSEPAFQVDGHYDAQAAQSALAQAGVTVDTYLEQTREQIETGQLSTGVEISDFLTPSEIARIYALENEQRQVRFALLAPDTYAAAAKIDDAAIKAWYQAHQSDYLTPESARLQYAQLSLDAVAAQLTVEPKDLQAYFDKNKARYGENEKRHAHHILIAIAEPKDAKADAAALAQAQQVLAQLKAGKDFGALAKQYSADSASAAMGGDLGWAERGVYTPPFDDALFKMQPGQLSDPVKTQFGYHIIRLDEVKVAHAPALEQAHTQVEADYRHEQAMQLFGDREEQLQQKLENGATDLSALAQQLGLQIGEVAQFTRSAGGAPLGAKPDLIQAVFNPDALGGKIAGPVAIADDRIVVAKVLEHHPSAPQPLENVRDQVIAAIRKNAESAAAKAAADAALTSLQAGTSFDAVAAGLKTNAAPALFISRLDPQVPTPVREAAFELPPPAAGKPAYRAVKLDNGGAALLEVSAVKSGTAGPNPKSDQELLDQFLKRDRDGDMNAYVLELQRQATVKRSPTLFQ
jgi:peptidyl-prolyl cis-trans isomerase D